MEKNFIIQKSKTQIIDASKTDAKVEKQLQCICAQCNDPFERLAYENYCHGCIREILRSSTN